MISFEYEVYRQEILDFLSTVTIKFDPFAKHYEYLYATTYGERIPSDRDNPYYLNMCGHYSKYDEPMYVTTIEDNSTVLFDLNLKENYPATAALYRAPSNEYNVLRAKYPSQVNLIKSIVYPVENIDTALNAKTFDLLAYDAGILYPTERDSIISSINKFLDYAAERWYVPDFDYENLFPYAFWSMTWSLLPTVCFLQRIKNLRTAHVHPMHVWEYLQSSGMKDFRSILTHNQSLFFYRNLAYLYQNKGKTSNLEILAENLLDNLYVALVGKNLYQDMGIQEPDCITTPEVISENVKERGTIVSKTRSGTLVRTMSEDFGSFENIDTMVQRMFMADLELDNTQRHVLATEDLLGTSAIHYMPSKFLEFKKYIIDARFMNLLINFLLQTVCYKWYNGRIGYRVKFRDNDTGTTLDLDMGEAIALLNYCQRKSVGDDPINIPIEMVFWTPYKEVKPTIPKTFNFVRNSTSSPLHGIVDIDRILSDIVWHDRTLNYSQEFDDLAISQFIAMMQHTNHTSMSAELKYHDCMEYLYRYKLLAVETIKDVKLTRYDRYDKWISTNDGLVQMLDLIENSPNSADRYLDLFERLIKVVIPLDDARLKDYFGSSRDDTEYYRNMTELFTSMNSYNVTFLDTTRDHLEYIFTSGLGTTTANLKTDSCIALPSLTQQIKYFVLEQTCDDRVKVGPAEASVWDIEETIDQELSSSVSIAFELDESVFTLLQSGSTVVYVETDLSKPLNNTTINKRA